MRRLAVLAAILSLAFAGCGGGGGGGNGSGAETAGPVHITFWHSETASAEQNLIQLVNEYNASQDRVKVEAIYQGNDAELTLKLITGLSSGSVPTVAYMSETFTQRLIDSGQVVPIQNFVERDNYDLSDFSPAALAYYTIDNTLYAMPYSLAVPVLYYNKIPFREVGLDPEKPPRDLDEATAMSRQLLQQDASGTVTRSGFSLNIEPWYLEFTLAGAEEPLVNNDNGRSAIATEVAFDNPAGRSFFTWWKDMVDEGLAVNVGISSTGADNLLALGAKRAVMTFSTSAALRSIMDALNQGVQGIELGIAPVPAVPGSPSKGSPGVYSRSLWVMSPRPKAEQEAGWEFIKWLMQPAQQAEWFAGSGYLPVRPSAYDQPAAKEIIAKYPEFRVPVDLFATTSTSMNALGALLGPFQEVRDGVTAAVESMLAGNASADDAMAAAVKHGNDAIRSYNEKMGR